MKILELGNLMEHQEIGKKSTPVYMFIWHLDIFVIKRKRTSPSPIEREYVFTPTDLQELILVFKIFNPLKCHYTFTYIMYVFYVIPFKFRRIFMRFP